MSYKAIRTVSAAVRVDEVPTIDSLTSTLEPRFVMRRGHCVARASLGLSGCLTSRLRAQQTAGCVEYNSRSTPDASVINISANSCL